jgi:hypothetical protein
MFITKEPAPPSYDASVSNDNGAEASGSNAQQAVTPTKVQPPTSPTSLQPPPVPQPTVYYYRNPRTNENVVSLLPPDHPEMICLQEGEHITTSKFGLLGILAAIFWFPLGIGICLLDRRVQCRRCGAVLSESMCR